jgi:pyruvate-formate lyase-activating enzyme
VNNISACCYHPPHRFGMVPRDWAYQSAQIEKTAIAGEQSIDIVIQTADGDKLTLSSDIKFASSAITYEELGRTSASLSKSQGQIISAGAASQLELTVEGTLDDQEKKEIKEVLMNLFKMVKDFIAGEPNTEETSKFAHLTTISEVKAEFDIKTSVTTAGQSYANYAAQVPQEEKPVIQEAKIANLPAGAQRVENLTDHMIRFVKDSGIEPSKILKRLNRRLSRGSNKLMVARLPYWHKMRLRQEILEDFAGKLKKLSSENQEKINNIDQSGVEKAAKLNEPATMQTTYSVSEKALSMAGQDLHFEIEYSVADES